MQIHIDTATDGPDEYRAARAALNELLGDGDHLIAHQALKAQNAEYGAMLLDETQQNKIVDDFRTVVQAEDDAEAAAAFATAPTGVNLNGPATVTIGGVTAEYLPGSADPAAQYAALGGTVTPPDVDKHGIPWDVRIHAGGKTKNADLSWRGKRGVSSDIVNAVTAELKGRAGLPAAAAPAVSPPMAPPAPPPATQAPPPPPSGPTFMDVTAANMAAIGAGKWTAAQAVALAQTLGLESIAGLQGRPDLIPAYLASVPAAQ